MRQLLFEARCQHALQIALVIQTLGFLRTDEGHENIIGNLLGSAEIELACCLSEFAIQLSAHCILHRVFCDKY
jgi:hypothetical protein